MHTHAYMHPHATYTHMYTNMHAPNTHTHTNMCTLTYCKTGAKDSNIDVFKEAIQMRTKYLKNMLSASSGGVALCDTCNHTAERRPSLKTPKEKRCSASPIHLLLIRETTQLPTGRNMALTQNTDLVQRTP